MERNLDLATAAGATNILRTFPLPPGEPEGQLPEGDFVLASPLAGWGAKQWPLDYYSTLAERLRRECGLPLGDQRSTSSSHRGRRNPRVRDCRA